ncbi:fibronectin type III domain-containing protein [Deefgea sp. CFH1-16]|uniref:fibronectin type III domain-containing protein n=1 Tax=Deefgea sp. CFH1-16 TaxID=2675457 RepID=UPI0015F507A6|nr:fibronectin type III domain-containing protein [Deefgea sp. CFH1-16]MBM5573477.1 hypothetical protein [Deefgea sp. CFH1-16]
MSKKYLMLVALTLLVACSSGDGEGDHLISPELGGGDNSELSAVVLQDPVISDSTITLRWNAVAKANSYKVLRRMNLAGQESRELEWGEIANISTTEFVDSQLDANQSYNYKVQACNTKCNQGTELNVSTLPPLKSPPEMLIQLGVQSKYFQIELNWLGMMLKRQAIIASGGMKTGLLQVAQIL